MSNIKEQLDTIQRGTSERVDQPYLDEDFNWIERISIDLFEENTTRKEINNSQMAGLALRTPETFNVDVDGGRSNGLRWTKWLRNFNNFIGPHIEKLNEVQQIQALLNVAGDDVTDIYEAKRDETKLKKDEKYKDIVKLLDEYFSPQVNTDSETLIFRRASQRQGESINSFYIRLKTLSAGCNFGDKDQIANQIKLQIIQTCLDKRIKVKAAQESMNLDAVLKFAQALESGSEALNMNMYKKEIGSTKVESAYQVRSNHSNKSMKFERNNSNEKKQNCFKCGYSYPHTGDCPAKGKTCNVCGVKDHFSSCCKKKNKPDRSIKQPNKYHRTNQLNNNEMDTNQTIDEEETYGIFAVNGSNKCPRITVNILGSSINMGVDTQASINAIRRQTFEKMVIKPKLMEDETVVFSFDGNKPLKSIGKFQAKAFLHGKQSEAEFIVFDGVRDDLLSYKTSVELDIVKLMFSVNGTEERTEFEKKMIEKYPAVFSGKIGELKDYEVEFHIKKDAKPVIQKERRIPFHLKDKIEKALDKMEAEGIIEKVGNNEPTTFISSIVPVPKPDDPDDIRITIDSREVNKSIERVRHNMDTIEDVAIDLNDAKFITKCDLKGSYHQLKIKESSRGITTFRSPKGLMRYKKLVMGINCSAEYLENAMGTSLNDFRNYLSLLFELINS